jgi:phosphoribosylamine---glycine ligase
MNIAVLGSGGREAALAWKLRVDEPEAIVFVLPGNPGIPGSIPVDCADPIAVARFCLGNGVGLVVVGPEVPLAAGIVDALRSRGLNTFGPTADAARLESSKSFAKAFMEKYGVATARSVTSIGVAGARSALAGFPGRVVVKYDGLAAGKGVFVCGSTAEAESALDSIEKSYGPDSTVVLEETLVGTEVSVIGLTDGTCFKPLPAAQDHKRLLDGDLGPNTGGMGAVAPAAWLTTAVYARIQAEIIEPTLAGIRDSGFDYRGFLYFGLMLTREGPKLLEYNARLGDPETQVILPALGSSLLEAIDAALAGRLAEAELVPDGSCRAALVFACSGYPESPSPRPEPISGLEALDGSTLFFPAGVATGNSRFIADLPLVAAKLPLAAARGRAFSICVAGKDPGSALASLYAEAGKIDFAGMQFRRDIGARWLSSPPELEGWDLE